MPIRRYNSSNGIKATAAPNFVYNMHMMTPMLLNRITINPEILSDYEDLEYEDILASLMFAAWLSQVKRIDGLLA